MTLATEPGLLAEYLSAEELCSELGIHQKTLARWTALRSAPPSTLLGRRVYYRRASVAEWLRSREQRGAA